MFSDWWNAREVIAIGTKLADFFRPREGREPPANPAARPFRVHQRELESFLACVTREVGPLRLNFFKRAKLLNSFKWRLREHGFDPKEAEELTQMVLFRLYGTHPKAAIPAAVEAPDPAQASARRIGALLT